MLSPDSLFCQSCVLRRGPPRTSTRARARVWLLFVIHAYILIYVRRPSPVRPWPLLRACLLDLHRPYRSRGWPTQAVGVRHHGSSRIPGVNDIKVQPCFVLSFLGQPVTPRRGRSDLFDSERRSAQRESDHFLTKRRRSDSVFTLARLAAVIKHTVERILIAKHVLKADHGC